MEKLDTLNLPDTIRRELSGRFLAEQPGSLAETCAQVEESLVRLMTTAVIDVSALEAGARGMTFKRVAPKRFLLGREVYTIKVAEYAANDSVLQVVIRSLNARTSRLIKKPLKAKVDSLGKWAEVQIFIEQALSEFQPSVRDACVTVLEAGYRWLAEYVRTALDELQNQIAGDLHSYLRQLFPEALSEDIFLFGIADSRGLYLLDDLGRRAAFDRAAQRRVTAAVSPLEVVTNFSTTPVELERLISKKALAEDVTLEGSFLESAYADTGLNLSSIVVYDSSEFAVQPVVREGNTLLVAAYPLKLRPHIEQTLHRNRGEFQNIVERGASSLRALMRTVFNQGTLPRLKLDDKVTSWREKAEYLELKPNVFGVGLNLNRIIRDLFALYDRKRGK